jgi:flagellar hook-associated protein 1 FlgK
VASPIAGAMGTTNKGSLQQVSLKALDNPVQPNPFTLKFTSASTYIRFDDPGYFNYGTANLPQPVDIPYTSGETITIDPLVNAAPPNTNKGWSVTLSGTPKILDTYTVIDIKDTVTIPGLKLDLKLNGGNATAMMNLRDKALFDGAAMTDGYASAISQIGIRTQSASYAATVSSSIAANLEKDRTSVSGVNLDEEAAKLIQFQQAYQASAKMIQIAQNIFDTLIQGLGR